MLRVGDIDQPVSVLLKATDDVIQALTLSRSIDRLIDYVIPIYMHAFL